MSKINPSPPPSPRQRARRRVQNFAQAPLNPAQGPAQGLPQGLEPEQAAIINAVLRRLAGVPDAANPVGQNRAANIINDAANRLDVNQRDIELAPVQMDRLNALCDELGLEPQELDNQRPAEHVIEHATNIANEQLRLLDENRQQDNLPQGVYTMLRELFTSGVPILSREIDPQTNALSIRILHRAQLRIPMEDIGIAHHCIVDVARDRINPELLLCTYEGQFLRNH